MKQLTLSLLLIIWALVTNATSLNHSGAYITTWDSSKLTTNEIKLFQMTGASYYWEKVGDEAQTNSSNYRSANSADEILPIEQNTGIYKVYIKKITQSPHAEGESRIALTSVLSWGDIEWSTMKNFFSGANNLTSIPTQAPDLSSVTSFESIFFNANLFNQSLNHWNVSNITNMTSAFSGATNFNGNIQSWSVDKVTTMNNMFSRAAAFNQNLINWNVASVEDMSYMFQNATSFNGNITTWQTTNLTKTSYMFHNATVFNQNIGSWAMGKVGDMQKMFHTAIAFNQPIGNWNTTTAYEMCYMFYNAISFNQNISEWNVENVLDLYAIFQGASSFNQNLSKWNFPKVEYLNDMFDDCGLDCGNYAATLTGWANNSTSFTSTLSLGASGIKYASAINPIRTILNGKNINLEDDIEIANCTLPVELLSFDARKTTTAVKLIWRTHTENNNSHFVLAKRNFEGKFKDIASIESKGSNSYYEFHDNQAELGTNYYQLQQVDLNGTLRIIGERFINNHFALTSTVKVYPNPSTGKFSINLGNGPSTNRQPIAIYDMIGQKVYETHVNNANTTLQTNLSQGIYFIKVDGYHAEKLIIR